jgi:hypothetical protein
MGHSFEDIRSHKALVCHKEHRCDAGVGIAWFVLLSDGYLIDCGAQKASEARAQVLAQIINEGDHGSRLSHKALTVPHP